MKKFSNVVLLFSIIFVLVSVLFGCGKAPITGETFKNVVKDYGYSTSGDDDGEIEAIKNHSSISFYQYDTVEEFNEAYETERSVIKAIGEGDGFKLLSYGDACLGFEADALFSMTAFKDNTGILCVATVSDKAEIIEILKKLGYI